jgi:hypothetical protein
MSEKSMNVFTHPAGRVKYTARQSTSMSTAENVEDLVVPTGKRWVLHDGMITNESNATIDVSVFITDSSNNVLKRILTETGVAHGVEMYYPSKEGTSSVLLVGHGAFPMILHAGQKIRMVWSADAGKAGTSKWYVNILELNVERP